ncbi:hypothetical protein CVT24_003528 [Panaeolus cyanescens]|uniref:Uncharacterized protein n=1 Tax=Panaeolus cyanescens TaxID=181874 RepID=A0A409Y789_9AGAR|nr:hypothetical protein CVT24_003528 [Panaeolus cyanescens]
MSTVLNSPSGSANPATSLSALWAYLLPALDHILKSPSELHNRKAPAIDFGLYAGIHSACYNYFTAQTEHQPASANTNKLAPQKSPHTGSDIYAQLDNYFAEAAREISLNAPIDDIPLVQYIVNSYNRYTLGAQSANRLLNYINRHYVKRAVDEGRGWLNLADVIQALAKDTKEITPEDTREIMAKKIRESRIKELAKWGFLEGQTPEQLAFAESCAEAASSLDRVVPISSLAHRRFRTEVIEPLLIVPKVKATSKPKHSIPKSPTTPNPARPKGRLARALREVLESNNLDAKARLDLASGLAKVLEAVGIPSDHTLRKKLDKYISSSS